MKHLESNDLKLIEDVSKVIKTVFNDSIIGLYIHGSAVLDSLKIRSDLDLLLVINRSITKKENIELTSKLLELSGEIGNSDYKRYLELTVLKTNQEEVLETNNNYEYMYGEWFREDYEKGIYHYADIDPDIYIVMKQASRHNYKLYGRALNEIYTPISDEELINVMKKLTEEIMDDIDNDVNHKLLTMMRIYFTMSTNSFTTKDKAAEWIKSYVDEIYHENINSLINTYKTDEYHSLDQSRELAKTLDNLIRR